MTGNHTKKKQKRNLYKNLVDHSKLKIQSFKINLYLNSGFSIQKP